MIQAELKNKIAAAVDDIQPERSMPNRQEDILTSNFFGIMKNLSQNAWNAILPEALQVHDNTPLKVQFWERYPSNAPTRSIEPDVVLDFEGGPLVFVEVKYQSPFGVEQLRQQWDVGSSIASKQSRDFHLLTLTRQSANASDHAIGTLGDLYIPGKVHHLHWEYIYQQLTKLLEEPIEPEVEGKFIEDLCEYLREKGLAPPKHSSYMTFEDYFPRDGETFIKLLHEVWTIAPDAPDVEIYLEKLGDAKLERLREALNLLFLSEDLDWAPPNDLKRGFEFLPSYLLQSDRKAISDFLYHVFSTAFYSRNLCLRATRDFSVSARTKSSGGKVVSFFTFFASNRRMKFTLRREISEI